MRQKMNYIIRPADLSFLYDGCKKCFYMKMVHNITQPSIPLPSIFSQIAGLLKSHYSGKNTQELHVALPDGIVDYGEKHVRSQVIQISGHIDTCYINGRFDIVVSFKDGTYGVIDFKTGNPNEQYAKLYSRQLHAYAYALEHPASNALSLSPISRLGLLYFYPKRIHQQRIDKLAYEADITWIEIQKDEKDFLKFVSEILGILEASQPHQCSATCQWCNYIDKTGKIRKS
jgi:hypothetical protein